MSKPIINIYWFKRDLRIIDNVSLQLSCDDEHPTLLIFLFEPELVNNLHYGERHWNFIQESIIDINNNLKKYKTILYFHGNAGDLTNRVHKLNELYKLDVNILIISWRGFSGNPGKPTEENLYNDARKSIEWLNQAGIGNKNIILYGESLGCLLYTSPSPRDS